MHCFTLITVALWTLAGAPLLCAGGVLAHACECEVDCVCEHEDDCSSDPCSVDATVRDDVSPEALLGALGILAPAGTPDGVLESTPSFAFDPTLEGIGPPSMPAPASALPLLL